MTHYCSEHQSKIIEWNRTTLTVYYEPFRQGIAIMGLFARLSCKGEKQWVEVSDMFSLDQLGTINSIVTEMLAAESTSVS